jgi:hypothetical protein
MKLFEQFKIQKPKNEPDHYELFVEGDWNDADYVSKTSRIEKKWFENDDYLLYFISYIFSWIDKRWDPAGKFNETKDWNTLFEDADISFDFLPYGYENDIHTVTKVKLDYVSNGIRYPVEIPNFDSLFDNDDDKKRKVLDSKVRV